MDVRTDTLPPPGSSPSRPGVVLAVLCLCQFMVLLDMTIVNVSLEAIREDLGLSTAELSYVATAYTTLLGGVLLLAGRSADHFGRKPLLLVGTALFALASLTAALAQEGWHLFVSRGVQGVGAAFLTTAALSTLTDVFAEGPARNRALGVWGALAGAGSAVGVMLGGILTDGPGWRWVFWINVPVGALALVAVVRRVPRTVGERVRALDVPGGVSLTAGLLLLVAGTSRTDVVGWASAPTIGFLGGGLALLAVFVVVELRSPQPLVDLRIFRRRLLRGANLVGLVSYGAGSGFFFVASLMMQRSFGYSPLETGFAYVPVALAVLAGAQGAARLVTRVAPQTIVQVSLGFLALAYLLVARAPDVPVFWRDLLGPFVLFGVFLGAIFVAVQILAFGGVTSRETGLAAGLINTSQEVGSAFGVAVLSTVAVGRTTHLLDAGQATAAEALHSGFRYALVANAGLVALALVAALVLLGRRAAGGRPTGTDDAAAGPGQERRDGEIDAPLGAR
jgi:EmrB/QacA subfamily drug resistance transporter